MLLLGSLPPSDPIPHLPSVCYPYSYLLNLDILQAQRRGPGFLAAESPREKDPSFSLC